MGKKRPKERKPYAGEVDQHQEEKKKNQKKTYSLGNDEKKNQETEDGIFKVQIPPEKEESILNLILESKKNLKLSGSVSKRLTTKKLTDLYNTLQQAGFKHNQIENAMSNTIQYGGDLIDALDWLCLNTQNDQLPEGFSQALRDQELKQRPKFDDLLKANDAATQGSTQGFIIESDSSIHVQPTAAIIEKTTTKSGDVSKDWILRYAEQSDDDCDEDFTDGPKNALEELDVNERYLELCAIVEDTKVQAAKIKQSGDKAANKEISKKIRNLYQEIHQLEQHPDFDKMMKICVAESGSNNSSSRQQTDPEAGDSGEEGAIGGFAMFEEQAIAEAPKEPKPPPVPAEKLDKRYFEYTKKQWTGKSPKQFLIDWVRKHLPKSPPPKYHKRQVAGNLWRSRCVIVQKDGNLEVTPEIVCDNVKDSEHLASILALYHLCKGQKIYQLLPPPYRDVWLEWQDAETQETQQKKEQENKPRDQFVKKLMKKLKISDTVEDIDNKDSSESEGDDDDKDEDDEGTWEDRLDNDDDFITPSPRVDSREDHGKTTRVNRYSDQDLIAILNKHQQTEKHRKLLETRQQLPVYQYREKILQEIKRQNVLVIAGETGSGKSTQIPQFILEDIVTSHLGSSCSIVCTEPRRISTTSLSNRVSDEIGEKGPGTQDSLCGYQIRFEVKKSESTRLLYCTTGVLLRKLQQDPEIKDVSHVIVDEVHERSVQSDFLLIILRRLLQKRPNLKIILMSATVDAQKFSSYFQHCPVVEIPGRTFPVDVCHLEDVIETIDYNLEEDSPYALRYENLVQEEHSQVSVTQKGGDSSKMDVAWTKDDYHTIDRSGLDSSKYCLKTRNVVTRMNSERINMEIILELIVKLDTSPRYSSIPGAVLIFMPGLAHIQELYELLTTDRRLTDQNRYRIIALHSILSSQDQNQAFTVPPDGVRKIVIATNIAETGITIPDVVFVVDTGKVKENRYIESSQMSSLEEVYVSKASAKQRQGRAGRVREGYCFRMYTKYKYESLRPYSVPEILRVPLEELCLHIMKCDIGDPVEILSQAIDPPQPQSIIRAMSNLKDVGACKPGPIPSLTPLGHHLATLPVNVRVGKMLIYGAILGCLEPVSIIGATMTDKSPFVVPLGKKDQVDIAKTSLSMSNSDHITLLRAYIGWKISQKSGYQAELQYCNKYFLKRNTLLDIQNVSNDLKKLVHTIGFDSVNAYSILKSSKATKTLVSDTGVLNISQMTGMEAYGAEQLSPGIVAIVKAVLTAGLYPQVAKITHKPAVDAAANPVHNICVGQTSQGPVSAHPGSVNRLLGTNGFLIYHEKVKGSRVYIRDSTLISCYPLLLFGGDITVQHKDRLLVIDEFLQFKAYAKTGVIFKELKLLLDNLLERKLASPQLNLKDEPLVYQLLDLIVSEK